MKTVEKAIFVNADGGEHQGELELTTHGPRLWNWRFWNDIAEEDDLSFIRIGDGQFVSKDHALADAAKFHITSKSIRNLL